MNTQKSVAFLYTCRERNRKSTLGMVVPSWDLSTLEVEALGLGI